MDAMVWMGKGFFTEVLQCFPAVQADSEYGWMDWMPEKLCPSPIPLDLESSKHPAEAQRSEAARTCADLTWVVDLKRCQLRLGVLGTLTFTVLFWCFQHIPEQRFLVAWRCRASIPSQLLPGLSSCICILRGR